MIVRFQGGRIALAAAMADAVDMDVSGGMVGAVAPPSRTVPDRIVDLKGGWLLPGFIDTQVNGGGGVLFNDHVDVDSIAAIGAAHARFGTTSFLPTLISDTPARIADALDAVDAAIERGVPGVVGIHVEGPFISEAKRGIHEAQRIRALDADMLALLSRPRLGKVMLTLAPELCRPEDVAALTERSVIVAAGHSNAAYDVAQATIAAGLRGFTHLFNAMSPLHHRKPGMVGAAFDSDCYCGLIVDDVHLHPAVVRLAIRAKGADRIMLVTDAMPSVGTRDGEFTLQGKRIEVRDGICRFEDGTLAGSHLDMASAVRNTAAITGMPLPAVAAMASATPANFLGLEATHGSIAAGQRADWVWLDADLQPRGTWIGGIEVDTAASLAA
ncbi:N-acetylglucosamine-6-phosphate deacetylase [Pelagerythrobacter sp.]|uniref:N-acetylglucosamine-6-phosphate deacetylase n=1 Tax=Pelagerythrobacter sp. TaxID=2800702 RepID=UPI0035AE4067